MKKMSLVKAVLTYVISIIVMIILSIGYFWMSWEFEKNSADILIVFLFSFILLSMLLLYFRLKAVFESFADFLSSALERDEEIDLNEIKIDEFVDLTKVVNYMILERKQLYNEINSVNITLKKELKDRDNKLYKIIKNINRLIDIKTGKINGRKNNKENSFSFKLSEFNWENDIVFLKREYIS